MDADYISPRQGHLNHPRNPSALPGRPRDSPDRTGRSADRSYPWLRRCDGFHGESSEGETARGWRQRGVCVSCDDTDTDAGETNAAGRQEERGMAFIQHQCLTMDV